MTETKKPNTGGALNYLNGEMRISAPYNSVPLNQLLRYHKPESPEALEQLIADHIDCDCPCGVQSQGTVEDFGRNLYEAQEKLWGEKRFSLKECVDWERDLFVTCTFDGVRMENECYYELRNGLDECFRVEFSSQEVDSRYSVDLEVFYKDSLLCGIQVKPVAYKGVRSGVKASNLQKNMDYGLPVIYAYYEHGEGFVNMSTVLGFVKELV